MLYYLDLLDLPVTPDQEDSLHALTADQSDSHFRLAPRHPLHYDYTYCVCVFLYSGSVKALLRI